MRKNNIIWKDFVTFLKKKKIPPTFTRQSVAYTEEGISVGSGMPRYHLNGGILIEEGTTNLLNTENKATGTDTSGTTSGFTSYGTRTTIASSTTYAKQGSRSLEVITKGDAVSEGCYISMTNLSDEIHTASKYVRMPNGAKFKTQIGSVSASYTGDGDWQYCPVTASKPGARVYTVTTISAQALTFYEDMAQIEEKPHPTSWQNPAAGARKSEKLTIPHDIVSPTQGTVELELYITHSLKTVSMSKYVLDINGGETGYLRLYQPEGADHIRYAANDGTNTDTTNTPSLVLGTWYPVAITWSNSGTDLYINGESVGTPGVNGYRPTTITDIAIGSLNDGSGQCNAYIRNVTFSDIKRTAKNIQDRVAELSRNKTYTVDKDVSYITQLISNLDGYRVKKVKNS